MKILDKMSTGKVVLTTLTNTVLLYFICDI